MLGEIPFHQKRSRRYNTMGKSSEKRTITGHDLVYTLFGFVSFTVFLYMLLGDLMFNHQIEQNSQSFVQRNGTHFTVDGKIFYVNGWNSYWLMDHAVEDYSRPRVREMMQEGSKMGLTVCRTWAFNDGAYNALQISPGKFDERVFKALDHVIAEARQEGIRLLLSLVNNLHAYGGKPQYVKWAWEEGVGLSSSNDSFFFDPSIRQYFKSYVKTMLTRKNTITGIEYRNDPTIFAWELINEPRCSSDPSGDTLQNWIVEMSDFVKSIDKKHLLTIGHEGFYGPNSKKASTVNPGSWATDLGVDFIRNSNISTIDFASVHIYPDQWFSYELELDARLKYASKWMLSHVEDGDEELKKPVLFTEFGMSNLSKDFHPSQREKLYKTVTDIIYNSAEKNKSGAGSLFWQFIVGGVEDYNDDFGIFPWSMPSTNRLFGRHSCRLAAIHGALPSQEKYLKQLCLSVEQ